MPEKGTIPSRLAAFRLISSSLYKRYCKETGSECLKVDFMHNQDVITNVIREFIIDDPEGVKLPYIGLLMPYRVKVTSTLKQKYAEKHPHRKDKVRYRSFFGKIAWIRYSVSRFKFSKVYSFKPERILERTVKTNANKSHPYHTAFNLQAIHDHGRLLLSLDDALTKKLKRLKNG
jgi:hypothetical protein